MRKYGEDGIITKIKLLSAAERYGLNNGKDLTWADFLALHQKRIVL